MMKRNLFTMKGAPAVAVLLAAAFMVLAGCGGVITDAKIKVKIVASENSNEAITTCAAGSTIWAKTYDEEEIGSGDSRWFQWYVEGSTSGEETTAKTFIVPSTAVSGNKVKVKVTVKASGIQDLTDATSPEVTVN